MVIKRQSGLEDMKSEVNTPRNHGVKPQTDAEQRFYADVFALLEEGRRRACVSVNAAMVETYWCIGRRIVEQEQNGGTRANYGDYLLSNLSRHLSATLGKGFSYANLRNFRQFYLTFPDEQICYTLCSKLSWSHNRLIMRIEDERSRLWYLKEARSQKWSVRLLERNIKTGHYKRLLSTQKTKANQSTDSSAVPTEEFIKDPLVIEFIGLSETLEGKESTLEAAIIAHLQEFLLEMGKGFSFVGRQFRISTETSHFYIDLVCYNYLLKCFVLIDLKTAKLTHQDIGQMDMTFACLMI